MKKYIKWIIAFVVATIIFVVYISIHDVYSITDKQQLYLWLSNGALVAGGLTASFGLLIFASNEGTFDIFVYGIGAFINLFRKDHTKAKYANFYEYRVAHEEKKFSFGYIVIIGLIYLLLAGLFLYLYYQV